MKNQQKIYKFKDFYIPERMMESISRYVKEGVRPGSFLTAVICNNLRGAISSADSENLENLPAFMTYFYNETPSECWGSIKKMDAWVKMGKGEQNE